MKSFLHGADLYGADPDGTGESIRKMTKRDLLNFTDLSRAEVDALLKRSIALKNKWRKGQPVHSLAGKSLGLIFDKPSTRTRVSFEVAMTQFGGHPVYLDPETTQIKRGEPIADSARVDPVTSTGWSFVPSSRLPWRSGKMVSCPGHQRVNRSPPLPDPFRGPPHPG